MLHTALQYKSKITTTRASKRLTNVPTGSKTDKSKTSILFLCHPPKAEHVTYTYQTQYLRRKKHL